MASSPVELYERAAESAAGMHWNGLESRTSRVSQRVYTSRKRSVLAPNSDRDAPMGVEYTFDQSARSVRFNIVFKHSLQVFFWKAIPSSLSTFSSSIVMIFVQEVNIDTM